MPTVASAGRDSGSTGRDKAGQRQHHTQENSPIAGAVNHRRFFNFFGKGVHIRDAHEYRNGKLKSRIGKN
ncbi:hypothetical protein FHS16_002592 [Paenibacillus endophyticus]|uniref:Uncharacterized protein n=1 Tax=Paenibacillus endophyticus TaxID=1294268 RepID=A0A7W5C7R0_9BACL|nr:hypothetical protein [Paenibacillus endophyticus]